MEILYQGYDITEYAHVRKCVAHDTADDRCDSLDIEFENAAGWYGWGPQEDDQIIVSHGGYDTGIMYVNTILPEDGKFRIIATSLPSTARIRGYTSFRDNTIEEIMRICAISSGMDFRIYGIDPDITIPYIERNYEGYGAFLCRLLRMEGATLKCVNGRFVAIGIEYAQAREAHQTITVKADMDGMEYRRSGRRYRALTIETPWASATAMDTAVKDNYCITLNQPPARDALQAGRWARGLLLQKNRQHESLKLSTDYNAGFTAMTRINIEDNTDRADAAGEWIIAGAHHDFFNKKSSVEMLRCISTIQ